MGYGFGRGTGTGSFYVRWGMENEHKVFDGTGKELGTFADYDKAKKFAREKEVNFLIEREKNRKRERNYFPAAEIPLLWYYEIRYNASNSGRGGGRGNFYFEGDTIYSYGSHFPIARHVQNEKGERAVLFTTKGYSNTTSGHKWAVRGVIPKDAVVFEVPEVSDPITKFSIIEFVQRVQAAIVQAARATKYSETHIRTARELAREAIRFANFFGLPKPALPRIPPATKPAMKKLRRELKDSAIRDNALAVLRGHKSVTIAE